jgi:serine/threonine-protein kinase
MGEVWRAFDTAMNRVVALKVLPPNFADDEQYQVRFRREAQAAAGLDEEVNADGSLKQIHPP